MGLHNLSAFHYKRLKDGNVSGIQTVRKAPGKSMIAGHDAVNVSSDNEMYIMGYQAGGNDGAPSMKDPVRMVTVVGVNGMQTARKAPGTSIR